MISTMVNMKTRWHYLIGMAIIFTAASFILSMDAYAAARTYQSKGSQENPRHVLEKCRLKTVEVVDGVTMCIYRSQTGRRVTLSNENPSAGCQKQFQCKR